MKFASGAAFLEHESKRLAFIGMSGVGKSTLAGYLDPQTWQTFCTDHALADTFLRPELDAFAGQDFRCGPSDISVLAAYVGKLGSTAEGGLPETEFRARQERHCRAERHTFEQLAQTLPSVEQSVLVDAGGSLVEILDFGGDDPLVTTLCNQVLFVYIQADETHEAEIIARQLKSPKPMYYHRNFLDTAIKDFEAWAGMPIAQAAPDAFIAYVFPRLMAHRRPRYEALARAGGVTISLKDANAVRSDAALLTLISEAIDAH